MQNICIIIPCYNEASRLAFGEFREYLGSNANVSFYFVNDGSKDTTLEILRNFEKENPEKVKILDLNKNCGKAEAIRAGMNSISTWKKFDLVGYFDSDLSAPLSEINNLLAEMNRKENFAIIYGSRIGLMGRAIRRKSLRHYFGRIFATIASILLKMPIYDTQCGAKLLKAELIPSLFSKPFITRWFFDLEMLFRLKRVYGDEKANQMVAEAPLYQWVEKKGSKLKMFDFIKVPFLLIRIYFYYRHFDPAIPTSKK